MKQVFPIFYVLMTSKRADCYRLIFSYIENNIFCLKPHVIMVDWEASLRLALTQIYSESIIKGCWYHYICAIRKKCLMILGPLLRKDNTVRSIYRQLFCVPLLPSEFIEDGFNSVKHTARFNGVFDKFEKIFDYYENYWMRLVINYHYKNYY